MCTSLLDASSSEGEVGETSRGRERLVRNMRRAERDMLAWFGSRFAVDPGLVDR